MQGKPIQIISIGKEDATSSSRCILQLNEDQLIPMLMDERIKDREVSVISIAGAFRKGKSFLLDFFLRYMYARYVDGNMSDNDWLGDDEEPLKGFSWRGGSKRDTTGILLWSEIFLYDYPTGEKVAIILMDTQGTFDCESTMKDCANVFALSTMISSVQIFNIQSNIQKDDLQHLQLFTEYARIAMKDTGKKPFQKLQFLIRDWPNEFEIPYGASGGKHLLETLLNSKEKRQEENEQLCENLKTSFNEVGCYLMPHPGLTVRKPDFRGCLKDLEDDFKKHLLDLIPLILAPENLIIKEINGEKLKVAHLLDYIQLYFESFNSKEFPEPTTIFKATAEVNNQIHATNAEELYIIKMKQLTAPEQPYIDEAELKKKHEEYMSESIAYFENKPIMGRAKFFKKFYKKINNYISSHFTQFVKINEAKLALAEVNYLNDKNSCIKGFETAMDDLFIRDTYTPQDCFKNIMENVKLEMLQQFDSKQNNSTEKVHTRIREELVDDLVKLYPKYNHQNEMKLALIKSNINMECEEAKKLYEELMNNSEQSIEALTEAHADAKNEALEMFRNVPHVGAEGFFKDCKIKLITKIDKKFNSIKEGILNKQQHLQLQLSQLKMNYETLMKDDCRKVLTYHNLLSKHKEFKGKVLQEFDILPTNGNSVNYMEERRQQFDEEIEEIFDYYRSKNDKCMNEFVQKCISTKTQAKNVLVKPLENLGMFDSVDDVLRTYNEAFNEALDLYLELKYLISFNQETFDKYLSELKEEFEAELKRCSDSNSFYSFPSEREFSRRQIWMTRLGVTSAPKRRMFACQRHFSFRMRNRLRLIIGAIPDMNLYIPTGDVNPRDPMEAEELSEVGRLSDTNGAIFELGCEDFEVGRLSDPNGQIIELGREDFEVGRLSDFSKKLFDLMRDVEPFYCCENSQPDELKYLFIRIRTYFSLKIFNREATTPHFKNIKFLCISHR